MSRRLILEIDDRLHQALERLAARDGRSVEAIGASMLGAALRRGVDIGEATAAARGGERLGRPAIGAALVRAGQSRVLPAADRARS